MSPAPSSADLLQVYDRALPQVYGYLLRRCGRREIAEELTSETFLAAAGALCRTEPPRVDTAWLIGVARHKLADHWRRQAREDRLLRSVASQPAVHDDPWNARLDAMRADRVLADLPPQYRLALVLRYLDDLPVAEVARLVERTLHATEALLVRARAAFRDRYTREEDDRD